MFWAMIATYLMTYDPDNVNKVAIKCGWSSQIIYDKLKNDVFPKYNDFRFFIWIFGPKWAWKIK
jgi:hypothetical protein